MAKKYWKIIPYLWQKSKSEVVPYLIASIGHGADPGFLAISLPVTVISPVVGCRYFPPGLLLFSQPKRSPPPPWPVPNYTVW